MNFQVVWFELDPSDELLGEEVVNITEDEVRNLIYIKLEDGLYMTTVEGKVYLVTKNENLDALRISKFNKDAIQSYLKHQIDLNKHDYWLERIEDDLAKLIV